MAKKKRKSRTKEGGKETETRILDAGEQVFARVGFAGASTQEIATAAGVTKAMIHYYFDSKEQLYRAVLDRILFELIRLVQDVTVYEVDRVERLERFLLGFLDYVSRHPHFGRLTTMGSGSQGRYFESIVTTFFRPLFEQGIGFIEDGIEEGTFRQVDARQLLLSIYNMAMGYCAEAHFISLMLEEGALEGRQLKAFRENVRDVVLHALGVESRIE